MRYEWFREYCLQKPGVTWDYKPEWSWERFFVGGKTFAAIGREGEGGKAVFLSVRCEPDFNQFLRQSFQAVAPGYYTNKEHWNTVWLDLASIPERDRNPAAPPEFPPDGLVKEMADRSYALILASLPKKLRLQVENGLNPKD